MLEILMFLIASFALWGGFVLEEYTDNIPIHKELFSSNWELSSARATTVLNFFVKNGYISAEKICSVGYG